MPTMYVLRPETAMTRNAVPEQHERKMPPDVRELGALLNGLPEHVTVLYEGRRAHLWVESRSAIEPGAQINGRATALHHNATRSREGVPQLLLYRDVMQLAQDRDLVRELPPLFGVAVFWPAPALDWEPEGTPWTDYQEAVLPPGAPRETPWGPALQGLEVAPGIVWLGTASHGCIWLSGERRAQLPEWAKTIEVPEDSFYDEASHGCIPILAFPREFAQHETGPRRAARRAADAEQVLEKLFPNAWAKKHGRVGFGAP